MDPKLSRTACPFRVTIVSDPDSLAQWSAEWQELEQAAIEDSPFLQPAVLLPAWEQLETKQKLSCALITLVDEALPSYPQESSESAIKNPQLHGLFPLADLNQMSLHRGIWSHEYCFNATPLVRKESADKVINAFLCWLDQQKINYFRFPELRADGPFYIALQKVISLQQRPLFVQKNHFRAAFTLAASADDFIQSSISKSTRKELLRLERRLGENGSLNCESLTENSDIEKWISDFMGLEQAGWKGTENTALGSQHGSQVFFATMARKLFKAKRLIMLKMTVDDEPIAMNIVILGSNTGAAFKISHAESFRRFSPGRLLELNFIRWLHRERTLAYIDSCAAPNHVMIESIWQDRQFMQSLWIGQRNWLGHLSIGVLSLLHYLKSARSEKSSRREAAL